VGKYSKDKGSAFERKVAKILSEAFGVELVRTPMSGGWGRLETKGDLVTRDDFPYHVECKKREGWNIDCLLSGKGTKELENWWNQTTEQCPADKVPLLVFSKNFSPIYVRTKNQPKLPNPFNRILYLPDGSIVTSLEEFLLVWGR
jgi:hypothetical protein